MDRAGGTATQAPFPPSLEPAGCPCDQWPKSNGKTQFKVIIHAVNIAQPCRGESRLGTGRMDLDGQTEKNVANYVLIKLALFYFISNIFLI